MFEIDSKYELEHEYSRQLKELEGAVDILGVGSRPDVDVNEMVVYYRVPEVSNRGKVLITNMKDNIGGFTYYFQPEQIEISGKQ